MTDAIKVDLQSKDIKLKNINNLKKLFPEIVTENKIDFDKLKLILGEEIDLENEKYGMSWPGKFNCFKIIQDRTTGTLKPVREESVNFDTTENLYIEGDNLEVLKILQKSYFEKIKMIYIDPPYNTGRDIVYEDKFGQQLNEYLKLTNQIDSEGKRLSTNTESEGRHHSNWMNMMYPRLYLARNLLKEDGVIFISIDDHEVDNLKKICNEIFGEENFIGNLKWKKKKQPSFLQGHIAGIIEYILVYAKTEKIFEKLSLEKISGSNKPVINAGNKESIITFKKGVRVKANVCILEKGLYKNKSISVEFLNTVKVKDGRLDDNLLIKAPFRTSQLELDKFCDEDVLFITENFGLRRDLTKEELEKDKMITDLLLDWGQNQDATNNMREIFGFDVFSNPKPVLLLKKLIKSLNLTNDDLIMDFFSGSATLAEAVFNYQLDEESKRINFILVQLPENLDANLEIADITVKKIITNAINFLDTINKPHFITEIAKERIRRVIKNIEDEQKQQKLTNENKLDLGFKVFKLDQSNFKIWDGFSKEIQTTLTDNIEQIKKSSNKEDILYELLLKEGFSLTEDITKLQVSDKQVYSVNVDDSKLLICLEDKLTLDLFKELKKLNPTTVIVLDKGFNENDQLKTNAVELLTIVDNDTNKKEYLLKAI